MNRKANGLALVAVGVGLGLGLSMLMRIEQANAQIRAAPLRIVTSITYNHYQATLFRVWNDGVVESCHFNTGTGTYDPWLPIHP